MDSVWYEKFIWVFFDTFTKVRTCGQHPGKMSRVEGGGHFYVFSFFHVSEHSEHIWVFFFFWLEKLIIFTDGGYGKFRENIQFHFLTLSFQDCWKADMSVSLSVCLSVYLSICLLDCNEFLRFFGVCNTKENFTSTSRSFSWSKF